MAKATEHKLDDKVIQALSKIRNIGIMALYRCR